MPSEGVPAKTLVMAVRFGFLHGEDTLIVMESISHRRAVRLHSGGIREVFVGDSEYWSVYIIIPRKTVLAEIRKLRAKGFRRFDAYDHLPESATDLLRCEGYGGPGRAFVNRPFKYKSSRKFVILSQSGGLDI